MKKSTGENLVREVLATAAVLLLESQRLFRPHGLTAAQFNVLNILVDGGPMSQREIGAILVVDRSNVTGLINRMEASGWVKRVADAKDGRVCRVVMTARGRKLWEKVHPLYRDAVDGMAAGTPDAQADGTLALLARLQDGARRWSSPET